MSEFKTLSGVDVGSPLGQLEAVVSGELSVSEAQIAALQDQVLGGLDTTGIKIHEIPSRSSAAAVVEMAQEQYGVHTPFVIHTYSGG